MPVYDVELDDGRTVTLEADSEPNERDIYAALQTYQPSKEPENLPAPDLANDPFFQIAQQQQSPAPSLQPELTRQAGLTLPEPKLPYQAKRTFVGPAPEGEIGPLVDTNLEQLKERQGIIEAGATPEQFASITAEPMRDVLFKPFIPIPKFEIKPNDSDVVAVGKEAVNLALGIPEFIESPGGVLAGLTGAIAPTLTTAGFTADLIHSVGKQIKDTYSNWSDMSRPEKTAALIDIAGTGAMAGLTGHATSRGVRKFTEGYAPRGVGFGSPETIKPAGETYASKIPSTESVPQLEVRPRVGEETPLRPEGETAGTREPIPIRSEAPEVLPPEQPPEVVPSIVAETPVEPIIKAKPLEISPPGEKFIGNAEAGDRYGSLRITGNFNLKRDAQAFAQESGGTVKGYLSGKYKRGWIVSEPWELKSGEAAPLTTEPIAPPPIESKGAAPEVKPTGTETKAEKVETFEQRMAREEDMNDWIKSALESKRPPANAGEAWGKYTAFDRSRGVQVPGEDYFKGAWESFKKPTPETPAEKLSEKPAVEPGEGGVPYYKKLGEQDALDPARKRMRTVPQNFKLAYLDGWYAAKKSAPKMTEAVPPQSAAAQVQTEVAKVAKTEGMRPAKEIKADYLQRVEAEIEKAIQESESNIEPRGEEYPNEWTARSKNSGAYGTIEKIGNKFKVSAQRPGYNLKSATFDSLEDAQWFIKGLGAEAEGKVTIHIPGDGDTTIVRSGEHMMDLWKKVKALNTRSEGSVRTSTVGAVATPEKVIAAYGSPEAAYNATLRQAKSLEDISERTSAEQFAERIYQNTKAASLEAQAENARSTAQERRSSMNESQAEIDRIMGLKKRTKAHLESIETLKERVESAKERMEFFDKSAESYEQQAALEKAKLESPLQPTPEKGEAGVISQGPGAASPGDVPPQAQIEQLGSAFKNINASKVPLTERVKQAFDFGKQRDLSRDLIGRSLSALKTSGDYLIDTWKGVRDVDPILKVKGKLSSELELRGWRMREAMKDMKQAVPNVKVREAISKWVDSGGDMEALRTAAETVPANRRSAYERAMQLTPEEKIFAEHIKSYFEARLQEAKDAGVLENGIEDYIHRIYPKETPWRKGIINAVQNGVLNTRRPGLAMKRFFEFDSEAEKAGLNPIGDFVSRVLDYEASLSKVIASREAVKRFTEIKMPDGRPMLDTAGIGIPIEGAEGIREATLIKPSFKPGEHQLDANGKPTMNYRKDYQARDYGALKKWKWATKDENGNPIYVQGDVLVHPDAVHRIDALLEPSKIRKYAPARAALAIGSTFKQTMLDFSGFHQVQIAIHALEHKVNPFNLVKNIDAENPNVAGLLRGGITLGGEHVTGLYQEGLVGRSLSRQIPGLGELMQTYHSWLFQNFIPRVKMTMALHALERNRTRFAKELSSGKMTEDALFYQTAKEANAAFGELNYIMLERSKTAQDMARLILLAPDFLEARGRFALQSGTKLGGEQRMALLLGATTLYLTARLMNKAINDEWHNEPENLFNVVYNGKAYSIRTVQGDILHAIEEPVKFWLHRLNPTMTRPLFELLSGRDEFGRKRDFWQVMGDTISNAIPISMRHGREQSIWTSLLNAFGGSVRRNSEVRRIYQAADEWKKKNNVRTEPGEFIYDPAKDIYRPLKLALLDGDESAAAVEYKNLIDSKVVTPLQAMQHFKNYANAPFSGSQLNERKFFQSLSEDQKKSYEGAKQERQRIANGFSKASGIIIPAQKLVPLRPKPVRAKSY